MKNAAHREMCGVFLCLLERGYLFGPHRWQASDGGVSVDIIADDSPLSRSSSAPGQKKPLCLGRHSGSYRLNPRYIASL
ncbi:hypothetical protein [Pseudomonas sp. AKS31]|uniref:hypothetical protein n=1 Tax=Pseudomonas sp. AKS31 TaxID=2949091 RepID=UPI00202A6771|nr:hypothetical protein [Pseudomonas sp. AKS31]MCL9802386.1 hypothetical protein [Pseudomonas sp. AKS31]